MLQSIARALEQRDQTLGHGARVAALAEPVALALGWDRERIRTLRLAAPPLWQWWQSAYCAG